MGALRPPFRTTDHRGRDGRCRRPHPRDRDGSTRRARRAQPRRHLLAVREPRGRPRPHRVGEPGRGDQDHPVDLRRAHQGGADSPPDPGDQEGRRARRRVVDPPARRALRPDRAGGGRGHLRRPVHRHDGSPHRHRVHPGRFPQAEEAARDPAYHRERRHLRSVPRADRLRRRCAPDRRAPRVRVAKSSGSACRR